MATKKCPGCNGELCVRRRIMSTTIDLRCPTDNPQPPRPPYEQVETSWLFCTECQGWIGIHKETGELKIIETPRAYFNVLTNPGGAVSLPIKAMLDELYLAEDINEHREILSRIRDKAKNANARYMWLTQNKA